MSDLANAAEDERKHRDHEHFVERRKAQVRQIAADIEETERQGLIKHETKMKDLREWRASHWGQKADELAIETQERFALTPNNVQRAHPRVHATYARPQTHILMHPCTEHTHILNQSLVDHTSTTYHS